MEVIVYLFYMMTMLIMLTKSRFVNIGVDCSYQFEPEYMSMMANYIIDHIDMDIEMEKRTNEKTRKYWVDKVRVVNVEGVELKLNIDGDSYDRFFDQKFLDSSNKKFLKPEESTDWVKEHIIGEPDKKMCDDQRHKEINTADMFTYQSIIFHTESILEM